MLPLPRIIAAVVLAALCGARAGAAPSPAPSGLPPLYLIVPFGEPGDTDPVLLDSTRKFSEDLASLGVRSALGIPTDAVEAVANARLICTQNNANGILISEMRYAQTKGFNVPQFAAGFIPYVGGVISGAGALDRTSIHAQYKLFLVDCRGKVVWRTITTAEKVHRGTNVPAGLTEISYKAIAEAADQFAARRAQAHEREMLRRRARRPNRQVRTLCFSR
jgi:hypothetical protein